jgi:hypothetical protein
MVARTFAPGSADDGKLQARDPPAATATKKDNPH